MKVRHLIILILLVFLVFETQGQARRGRTSQVALEQPGIGLDLGFINFRGDMGSHDKGKITFGGTIYVSRRFGDYLGASVNLTYGQLANEFNYPYQQNDFRSTIAEPSLRAAFHFDKLLNLEEYYVIPYVGIGFGMVFFKTYGNLFDPSGRRFYFWKDGSIRDQSQWDYDPATVQYLARDKDYETLLNSKNEYSNNALFFLSEFGLKFRITSLLFGKISAAYRSTNSDYIDHAAGYTNQDLNRRSLFNHNNDGYWLTTAGLYLNLSSWESKRMVRTSRRR